MILSYCLCLHCLIVLIETYCKNRSYFEQNVEFDDVEEQEQQEKEEISLKEAEEEVNSEKQFFLKNQKNTTHNSAITIEYDVVYKKNN